MELEGSTVIFFVVFFGLYVDVASETCPTEGWFGGDCRYLCHCKYFDQCQRENGTCNQVSHESKCMGGFAGTACQYGDISYGKPIEANFPTINPKEHAADGSESTCFIESPDHQNLPLSVVISPASWADVIHLYLYQDFVTAGKAADANNLEVSYFTPSYDNEEIQEEVKPDALQMDETHGPIIYRLTRPAKLSKLHIRTRGNYSLGLCEVDVLGGRNMSLKKDAKFDYDDDNDDKEDNDDNPNDVVDGDPDSCLTGGHLVWRVKLGQNPVNFWRFKAVFKSGADPDSKAIMVNATDHRGSQVTLFSGMASQNDVIEFDVNETWLVTDVSLAREDGKGLDSLCEVEVIGDCQDGYFGWLCDKECRCEDNSEVCDKVWGYCPLTQCKTGWEGEDCQEKCPDGEYGKFCAQSCSQNCKDGACNHVTGKCTNGCVDNSQSGFPCEECESGLYGEGCKKECPRNCRGAKCNPQSGECKDGCRPGWRGDICSKECIPGYFGPNCNQECKQCSHCHHVTGKCPSSCEGEGCSNGVQALGASSWLMTIFIVTSLINVVLKVKKLKSVSFKKKMDSQHAAC